MKHLTAIILLSILLFASCQKEPALTNVKDISYTQGDFVNNEAIVPGAEKADDRKSDLKVVIRKVNNAVNTYRLVLKVDSVRLNSVVPTDNPTFQPITGQDNVVFAGLSVANPTNPDVDQVIFTKEQMVFRQTNENGYFVYVSDPFETTINFDYELVSVEYAINLKNNGLPLEISDKAEYFILPGGRSIEQAPEVARLKPPRINLLAGSKTVRVGSVISNDPAGQINKVTFKGSLAAIDVNQKPVTIQLQGDLTKTVSSAIGVSAWSNLGCLSYYNEATKEWRCLDAYDGKLSSTGTLSGTLTLHNQVRITATVHFIDDWQGETGNF
jgi:hypothetical protein